MGHVFQFLAISGKENRAGPGAVTNTDHVALEERGAVWRWRERLIVSTVAGGLVGNRGFVEAWRIN